MGKSTWFAIGALMFYGLGNVLLEYKFSKYNNLSLIVVYGSVIVLLSMTIRLAIKSDDPSLAFPVGSDLIWLVGLGVILFVADYLYIGAYTNKGNILTITMLVTLLPVSASLFKLVLSSLVPEISHSVNSWQIAGFGFGLLAVFCVMKGNVA